MNNNDGLGCLGTGIAIILVLLFFGGNAALFSGDIEDLEFAVVVAVIADSAIAIWLLSVIGKAVGSSHEKRHEKNLTERKEIIVRQIGNQISHKNEIQQTFDRHFEKIERQFSLVSLISSCMGNNNQELKNSLLNNKEEAFTSTKNEIFDKLSEDEKKRFPERVDKVVDYKKTLEQEISELKTDLSSVATSDDERITIMLQKHCPELYKSIKCKRRKLIASIVIPATIIISLSIVLSSGFAFNLAKGYHQTVLKEKLAESNISTCSIYNITYEEQHRYSWEEDDAPTHNITDVKLNYNGYFSECSEDDLEKILQHLYRKLNVNITYRWAQHNLSFKTDKYDYNIILIDNTGESCSYDGKYFDIDK